MALTSDEVLQQSKNAFGQWESKWREQCKVNGKVFKEKGISQKDMMYKGKGRTGLLVAYAPSFEDNINVIKENINRDTTDVFCVDKCIGDLIKAEVKPNYVLICDASISYEKWCEPYIDQTEDITLISNINANPKWAANWKGPIHFFVNKDNIESEKIFTEISGCKDLIPAGSNVGNSVVIFATHILRYSETLLCGYDFCWGDEDNYYAFNDSDKRYWMKHLTLIDNIGRLVFTSNNLHFSCKWLADFYHKVCYMAGLRFFNCSGKGILPMVPMVDLKKKLNSAKLIPLSMEEKQKIMGSKIKSEVFDERNNKYMNDFLKSHQITNVIVNHVDKEVLEWLN